MLCVDLSLCHLYFRLGFSFSLTFTSQMKSNRYGVFSCNMLTGARVGVCFLKALTDDFIAGQSACNYSQSTIMYFIYISLLLTLLEIDLFSFALHYLIFPILVFY